MKVMADENLDTSIVNSLCEVGFDVSFMIEDLPSIDDDEVLAIATKSDRIVLRQDKGFGDLVIR